MYNHDARPINSSPNDSSPEYLLRDGTHIIFPFDLDESTDSDKLTADSSEYTNFDG